MNKVILIDNRIAIRNAIASIMKEGGFDVVETTFIENVFDLNRITFKDRVNLKSIIISPSLITSETKETIKRILSNQMYEDVTIYIVTLETHAGDQNSEAGYTIIANSILAKTRSIYITKYKTEDEE